MYKSSLMRDEYVYNMPSYMIGIFIIIMKRGHLNREILQGQSFCPSLKQ